MQTLGLLCVTGSHQVEAAVTGANGLLAGARAGLVIVDCSTSEPESSAKLLDNARKDVRYYAHLAESLNVPTVVGEAAHQSLALASALGHGGKFVASLVEAQEQLTGAVIVGR